MLSGFNTNIRYRGVLFHVQTEDSGRAHPHIITHLYYAGTIISSEKREYQQLLASEDLPSEVKRLMEEQHRAMVARLHGGEFDQAIQERLGDSITLEAPAPAATSEAAPASEPAETAEPAPAGERPLDEMVLEYLLESARRRKRINQ